jgi:hypothetical protein
MGKLSSEKVWLVSVSTLVPAFGAPPFTAQLSERGVEMGTSEPEVLAAGLSGAPAT